MVLPGQYLERPALIPCGDLLLEGLSHRGARRPSLLVCPPVGAGGMDAPAVAELAWASARAGHASLRFQHRGRGASQGAPDPERALDDAAAAWDHLAATAPGGPAVAGVGEGCRTALALVRARGAAGVVLLGPSACPALDGVDAPVLLVVPGDAPAALRRALAGLGGGRVRVELVPGADAAFLGGLALAGRIAAGWLGALVPAGAHGR